MNVDDVVAEKIAAARARAEAAKRRRAAFAAARKRGLALRHAAKLRNQASVRTTDGSVSVSSTETNDRGPAGTSVKDSPSPANTTEENQ